MIDTNADFRAFVTRMAGFDPGPIVADGRWHRFNPGDTKHKSSKPARYMMHADGRANGLYMDWRDGKKHQWKAGGEVQPFDRDAADASRRHREEERIRAFRLAGRDAAQAWSGFEPASDEHPYLVSRSVRAHGVRVGRHRSFGELRNHDCLLIPIAGPDGQPLSMQAIAPDGQRRYWSGSTKDGGHFVIGDTSDGTIVLVEGYATGASIHEATGWPVLVCFDAENMVAVARWATHRWAGRDFVVAGDDDWHLPAKDVPLQNKGKDAAYAAARILGGRAVLPDMAGLATDGGDDFNDVAREMGLDEVREQLMLATETTPAETPLPLLWYDDIQPLLSNNWLIKNVVPAAALVTVIGHPGCGKSFLALDMSLHIATGREWQGHRVEQGLVVYLAAEGQRGQQNRVAAWRQTHGGQRLPFALLPVAVNLRDPEADIPALVKTIEAAVQSAGVKMVLLVVDTLNRTFGGGDENGEDMTQYVANVGRLQAMFGCTAMVVHHMPKNTDSATERGHGSLRGAVETSLYVKKDPETTVRTLTCTKQKDAEDGWSTRFDLKSIQLGHDEDGDPVTSCVIEAVAEDHSRDEMSRGPRLSPVQRQVYNELMATLEAASIGTPRDIPEGLIPHSTNKVVSRAVWRDRYVAVAGTGESARRAFDRAVVELNNKGLIGGWHDVIWPVFS